MIIFKLAGWARRAEFISQIKHFNCRPKSFCSYLFFKVLMNFKPSQFWMNIAVQTLYFQFSFKDSSPFPLLDFEIEGKVWESPRGQRWWMNATKLQYLTNLKNLLAIDLDQNTIKQFGLNTNRFWLRHGLKITKQTEHVSAWWDWRVYYFSPRKKQQQQWLPIYIFDKVWVLLTSKYRLEMTMATIR